MSVRLERICSHLTQAESFADIGCDHGYCTQYMLENDLCERAYISDISRGSLQKAERLLQAHIQAGRCKAICADGMQGLPEACELVLIAGMGGEEIIRILDGRIPPRFVLQPMKNSDKVRAFLLANGCKITADYTFFDGKYYDLIAGEGGGGDSYSDFELLFGRDNLKNPGKDFIAMVREEQAKLRAFLAAPDMSRENRDALRARLYTLEEITDAVDEVL